jgi:flagellar motor switch protein FliN/FliY
MAISTIRNAEASRGEQPAKPGAMSSEVLRGVRVALDVKLGQVPMTIEDVMALAPGSVVTLATGLAENIDLYLNDSLIARGEVVAVGDKYGVRIVEIVVAP